MYKIQGSLDRAPDGYYQWHIVDMETNKVVTSVSGELSNVMVLAAVEAFNAGFNYEQWVDRFKELEHHPVWVETIT